MIVHQITNSSGNFSYNAYTYAAVDWFPHFHKNFELIYVIGGAVTLTVDSCDERLTSRDFALVLPNRVHKIISEPDGVFWIIVFSEDYVPEFAKHVRGKSCDCARFECDSGTEEFLREKLIEKAGQNTLLLQGLLLIACEAFLSSVHLTDVKESGDAAFQAFDLICQNYGEDTSLDGIARKIGYDYHYLSRCLSRTFHMNFRSILNQCRCDRAAQLLRQGVSVTSAAFESGFQSVRTFNDVFKKYSGTTPAQFRKKM